MADNRISARLVGADAVEKRLREFGPKLARKVLSRSLRAGAKIVHSKAKALAPSRTGRLRKSLRVRAAKSRKGRISIMVVSGAKWFTGPAFYGAFVEFGFRQAPVVTIDYDRVVSLSRAARSTQRFAWIARKKIDGKGFVAQAYEETKTEALKTVETSIAAGIEETAKA